MSQVWDGKLAMAVTDMSPLDMSLPRPVDISGWSGQTTFYSTDWPCEAVRLTLLNGPLCDKRNAWGAAVRSGRARDDRVWRPAHTVVLTPVAGAQPYYPIGPGRNTRSRCGHGSDEESWEKTVLDY